MCGVIGLIYERSRADLGRIAAELLKTLEYRGYDSTGAAIQDGERVRLAKGVGAPSVMVDELGITSMAGQIFCGQVRWATFGAVDDANSQPHVVYCKTHVYGAHNGNVTNSDDLKMWLTSEGHDVMSDNDGEMVVHTVEHYFARELGFDSTLIDAASGGPLRPALTGPLPALDPDERRLAMRRAWCLAAKRLVGSYAAVVVDPVSRTVWAVKQGSSLYFGIGKDQQGQRFAIASSDLSSVLKLTRVVVPLSEGELVEYTPESYQVHAIRALSRQTAEGTTCYQPGEAIERAPVRSRLRAKDTALLPPFETFMDQEISAQEQTCRNVVTIFSGGSPAVRVLSPYFHLHPKESIAKLRADLDRLRDEYRDDAIRAQLHELVDRDYCRDLLELIPEPVARDGINDAPIKLGDRLNSSEAGFFTDLLMMARDERDLLAIRVFDALLEREEAKEFGRAVDRFAGICMESLARGGRIFVVSCGSSYHAAKAAALFFNEIAHTELIPILPGEFRGQYAKSLRDGDLFIAVSQSGETKDLIDVLNYVIGTGRQIGRVAIVNNVNSTLAEEKSHLVIPLRCGPEIAVPATKSFVNQMVLLYCLALKLGQKRLDGLPVEQVQRDRIGAELDERLERVVRLPDLIRETFDRTDADVEKAAQLLFLAPSIHILATRVSAIAMEGALKVREVVLNHTEGFEGSEFKHGPNTILGFNTIFGPLELDAMLKRMGQIIAEVTQEALDRGWDAHAIKLLVQQITDSVFSPTEIPFSLNREQEELLHRVLRREDLLAELYTDYPLIFVTGPDALDVALTISQINTHKIRGASAVMIAEDHPALRQATVKAPADNPSYRSVFVTLPRTEDTLMTVFSATVVLQRLALKMSLRKMAYLDLLGITDHGVHPDVPKNVSKSITVD